MIAQTTEEITAKRFWDRLAEILKHEDATLAEVFRNNKRPLLMENMKRFRNVMPSEKYIQTIAEYIGVSTEYLTTGEALEIPYNEIPYPDREEAIARLVTLCRTASPEDWELEKKLNGRLFNTSIEYIEGIPFYAPYSRL